MSNSSSAASIDIWAVHVQDLLAFDLARDLTDEAEKARAAQFHAFSDRETFIRGHGTVRTILASYLSLPPASLHLTSGPYGKPYLPRMSGIHFNWSHGGDYWLLAVTHSGSVGVDIEKEGRKLDWEGPASVAFHPAERFYVAQGGCAQIHRFYEVWTRKEAILKAVGTGLHDAMVRLSIVDDDGEFSEAVNESGKPAWHVYSLDIAKGYFAAVAACAPAVRIHRRTYVPTVGHAPRKTIQQRIAGIAYRSACVEAIV